MNDKEDSEKKKRFTAPEQIKFAKQTAPKPLPKPGQQPEPSPPKIVQGKIKLDINLKPLKSEKSEKSTLSPKKLTLRPEDIKMKLSTKIEKLKHASTSMTVKPTTSSIDEPVQEGTISEGSQTEEPPLEPIEFPEHEENITDLIESYGEFNFAHELQKLIVKQGSSLSIELCEKFIQGMLDSFETALKYEDLKLAAEIFVNTEKSL